MTRSVKRLFGHVIVLWIGGALLVRRNGEWWQNTRKGERVMRRYVDGKWQIRPMTPDQARDDFADRAW
jgi:hypothetical protein